MGKQSNLGLGGVKGFNNRSIQIGPSSSQVFTVADFVSNPIGRPIDPNIKPPNAKPTINPSPVPGTGAPIVSNNPIQASSPYLSALQSVGGNDAAIPDGKSEDETRKWKIGILVLVALFLIYHFYRENK